MGAGKSRMKNKNRKGIGTAMTRTNGWKASETIAHISLLIGLLSPTSSWATSPQDHADQHCRAEHTKLGVLQQDMYDYCVKQDLEGEKQIEFFQTQYSSNSWFKDFSYPACDRKWTKQGVKQLEMIAYCLKQEKDGIDELTYTSKQSGYDKELASACFKKWQTNDDGPFNMTAYCYKNSAGQKDYLIQESAGQTQLTELAQVLGGDQKSGGSWYEKVKSYFSWGKPSAPKATGSNEQQQATHTTDASPAQPVDSALAVAEVKAKRVFDLAPLLGTALSVRGTIAGDKSFSDFPEVVAKLRSMDLASKATQLLVVSVGSPALLITTKTSFGTTGYFNMMVLKLFDTETTMGTVPVLMEFDSYASLSKEFDENVSELEKFTIQYAERELPKYRAEAERIKRDTGVKLKTAEIASILLIHENGKSHSETAESASTFLFSLTKAFTLCQILKDGINPTSWKEAYAKLAAATKPSDGNEALNKVYAKLYCADGGPFTYQDNILSFQQCMCDNHRDALVPGATSNSNMKEFGEMLARTIPESADTSQPQRAVASDSVAGTKKHKK